MMFNDDDPDRYYSNRNPYSGNFEDRPDWFEIGLVAFFAIVFLGLAYLMS